MRKASFICLIALALVLSGASVGLAKEMAGRIGVGYNGQIATSYATDFGTDTVALHSMSAKFWINDDMGIQGVVGLNTWSLAKTGGYDLAMAGKFLYNIIQEQNMNFFTGGGLGLMFVGRDYGKEEKSDVGFNFFGGAGFEWYFQGLPNLGFSAEIGLQYVDLGKWSEFGSYGGAFTVFGIHYYF